MIFSDIVRCTTSNRSYLGTKRDSCNNNNNNNDIQVTKKFSKPINSITNVICSGRKFGTARKGQAQNNLEK
jgi:hypothetical protein